MSDPRSGDDGNPVNAAPASYSGSAPTIDPSVPAADPITATDLPQKLGRFAIRGLLGVGAFGTVYRAYDPQLEREVALKVARSVGQSPERMQRFRREARAAAGLRHTHIVPLFEAGEADGHLYLAVAYVPGQSLEEELAKRDGRPLPPEQAAAIVRKLADALSYAHAQGVLHRDVKAANVLLDPAGEPHLLDFGLARRAEDQERMTVAGAVLGTAAYLAPEAARGDEKRWTPAVDQYALGVVLYELLTGHTPFTGPVELVLALHQTQDAERPSRRNREVPRDLDAICLKCLEKDPAQRYVSASAMAADLDRFGRGEPVLAQRQTMRYLAGKFVRRYRRPLAVVAALLLLVAAGVAGAFWRINAERNRVVEALEQAEASSREAEESSRRAEEAREAEAGFQEARLAIDEFLTELSQEGLKDVPGLQSARLKFAQRAAARYDRYALLRPGDVSVLGGQARSLTALGSMKGSIGSVEEAQAALKRAVALGERLLRENPERRDLLLSLARAYYETGYLYWVLSKHDEGVPHLEASIKLLESIPPAKASVAARLLLAHAYNSLGNTVRYSDGDEGRQKYEKARDVAQKVRDEYPNDPECILALSPAIGNLAIHAKNKGDFTEALRLENAFLDLIDEALRLLPNAPGLTINRSIGLDGKARALSAMGRKEEALVCSREAVAISRRVAADNPLVPRFQWNLTSSLKDLADRVDPRSPERKALLDESRRILETLVGKSADRVVYGEGLVDAWVKIADYYQSDTSDKADPAERSRARLQALEQAVREGRHLVAKHPRDREAIFKCSEALYKRGLFDAEAERLRDGYPNLIEAVEKFRAALASSGRQPTADQAQSFLEWCNKTQEVALALNRPDDVVKLGAVSVEFGKIATQPEPLEQFGHLMNRAGTAHEKAGRYKDAIECYRLVIVAGRPVLDKHPWHFYLREKVTGASRRLALACQHEKDVPGELQAWREHMKTWLGPYCGLKIDDYVRPDAPMTEKEVIRVRAFVATATGMKRFSIPCDFSGVKYPLHVYVTNYVEPHDVLADQARWLHEVRGGTIPTEVLDAFKRLYRIAKENKVSFIDLCVYALGTASDDATKSGQGMPRVAIDVNPDQVLWKEPKQETPKLLRDLADLKVKWEAGPANAALTTQLLLAYKKLGDEYHKQSAHADAVAALAAAVRIIEARPVAEQFVGRRLQAELYLALGKAHDGAKDYERAELCLRRHVSLLEDVAGSSPTLTQRAPTDAGIAVLAGVIRRRGQLAEAARTCAPAVARGSVDAADALAAIVEANDSVADVLTVELRLTFRTAVARARRDKKPVGRYVAEDVLKSLAAGQRAAADLHRAASRRAEYRRALADEYEAREAMERLSGTARLGGMHSKVAAELADAWLQDKEPSQAALWADRAGTETPVETLLKLAEAFETGTDVKADPKRAVRYAYDAYYRRGSRLLREKKYKEAMADLTKLCRTSLADGEDFGLLGICHGKLDQWEEAVKAYQRSYQLDPSRTGNVLGLMEALIVAGRAKEVSPFAAKLNKTTWSPEASKLPAYYSTRSAQRRELSMMNGLLAIAEKIGGDEGETAAEKKLYELTSLPGFVPTWDWGDFDAWFEKAKLSDKQKIAVRRLVDELKGKGPERTTPLLPLAVGAKWTYAQKSSDDKDGDLPDVTVEVVAKERIGGVECYQLRRVAGDAKADEHVVVRYDGVYRVAENGKALTTPYRMLALPPAKGQTWREGTTKLSLLPVATVQTPAGKYEGAWAVREETNVGGTLLRRTWYANGVGLVKIETPSGAKGEHAIVLTLKAYQAAR